MSAGSIRLSLKTSCSRACQLTIQPKQHRSPSCEWRSLRFFDGMSRAAPTRHLRFFNVPAVQAQTSSPHIRTWSPSPILSLATRKMERYLISQHHRIYSTKSSSKSTEEDGNEWTWYEESPSDKDVVAARTQDPGKNKDDAHDVSSGWFDTGESNNDGLVDFEDRRQDLFGKVPCVDMDISEVDDLRQIFDSTGNNPATTDDGGDNADGSGEKRNPASRDYPERHHQE